MHAREAMFESPLFGDDMAKKIPPIMNPGDSDTASFDNALELLLMTGRDLDHAMLMMIPEAWDQHETMPQEKKDFYEYHSALMEPWDGPAMIVSSDGRNICALLDRNGLRPFRYLVTTGGQAGDGLRDRRAGRAPWRGAVEGAPAAGPHVPGKPGAGPHHRRRGTEAGPVGATALRPVAEGEQGPYTGPAVGYSRTADAPR